MSSSTVTSKDGTRIACEITGSGPPIVLVDGAFCFRGFGPMPKLAPVLARHFTVVTFDRRGRGESPSVARPDWREIDPQLEVDDVIALVDGAAGGSAFLYGCSSGAMLAARAAAQLGAKVKGLVTYEAPLALDGTHTPSPVDFREQLAKHLAAGDGSSATELFMRVVGVPAFGIFMMKRVIPGVWPKLSAVAATLGNDFAQLGDTQTGKALPDDLAAMFRSIDVPASCFWGGKSPAWMKHGQKVLAKTIAGGRTSSGEVRGADHNVSAKAIAPKIIAMLSASAASSAAAAASSSSKAA